MPVAISIEDLNFAYAGSHAGALENINLKINRGEFIWVAGPNRAGKSTFCLVLNRLIPEFLKGEFSGSVVINNDDISGRSVSEMGRMVGVVFQDFESQIFSTRVDLEISFGMESAGCSRDLMKKRVGEVLEIAGLTGLELRNPATLSGGQKQRLAIASVLALEPDILVLDESMTDLDPAGRKKILEVLKEMKKKGKTIIIVEHEVEDIAGTDSCAVFSKGRLANYNYTPDVLKKPSDMRALGIMPHPVAELFERLGVKEMPLEIEDAYKVLEKIKLVPDRADFAKVSGGSSRILGEPVIEFQNVSHIYNNGIAAVKNINLSIAKGDFVAIVGQNGSGKTTLAKHINRLLEPAEGMVRIFGDDVRKLKRSEIGLRVGYVFQNPDHQIFCETVYDEVAFAPKNFGMAEQIVRQKSAAAIETVGLMGQENADPFMLTRGEREKVAVASALSASPEIIILDEPTTGLDYSGRIRTMEMLRKLNESGKTVIIITHAMNIVAEYAKTAVAMKDGEIRYNGPVRKFFSQYELLGNLSLEAPLITRLGMKFGIPLLNTDEMVRLLL